MVMTISFSPAASLASTKPADCQFAAGRQYDKIYTPGKKSVPPCPEEELHVSMRRLACISSYVTKMQELPEDTGYRL